MDLEVARCVLGFNRDPANRALVMVGAGGDHQYAIVSENLPSFKRCRRRFDLIHSHAKFDTLTDVL
jgi:hypothetical protein